MSSRKWMLEKSASMDVEGAPNLTVLVSVQLLLDPVFSNEPNSLMKTFFISLMEMGSSPSNAMSSSVQTLAGAGVSKSL